MADAKAASKYVDDEIVNSKLPSLPKERMFSLYDHTCIQIAFSVATWLFVTGAATGMLVPLRLAIPVTFIGTTIPLILQSFFGNFFARWGVDQAIGSRATFGPRLAKWLILIVAIPVYWGWASIPATMFGRAAHQVGEVFGYSGWASNAMLWGLVCVGLGLFITYKGPVWVNRTFRVASPAMIVLIAIVTVVILVKYGWSHVWSIEPKGYSETPWQNFIFALEINIGLGFSWLFNFSAFTRLCKTETSAYYGTFLGWGFFWAVLCIPGILGALVAQVSDPVGVLATIGGGWTVLYLGLLLLANPSSQVCEAYWISVTLKAMFPRLKWGMAVLLNASIVFLVLWPGAYDQFAKFITFIAAIFGALGAVWIVDVLLRRLQVRMRDLYDESPSSVYWYWKGMNLWSVLCAGLGATFSLVVFNPLTGVIHYPGVFSVAGASLPGAVIAGVCYFAVARLYLMPRGIGFPVVALRSAERLSAAAPAVMTEAAE